MGFRFQRRITLFPGVRLNLSNGSPSLSLGPQGASLTVGTKGTYANLGLPGTGLSYRTRLDQAKAGKVGKTAGGGVDLGALQAEVEALNLELEGILNIHRLTPSPATGVTHAELQAQYEKFRSGVFDVPAPVRPQPPVLPSRPIEPVKEEPGFFSRLFGGGNTDAKYEAELARWKVDVVRWERECEALNLVFEQEIGTFEARLAQWTQAQSAALGRTGEGPERYQESPEFLAEVLELGFGSVDWPRETRVAFQVVGDRVLVDVDLPEIEDFPDEIASLPAKKTEIVFKKKSEKQQRLDYARYVHGCLFRVAGVALACLPGLSEVTVSGYTQAISKKTGFEEDMYLLSCKIPRTTFAQLNFAALDRIDPVEAMMAFENRRSMTATGIFKAITPFGQ